jgi:hypothetical protein
VHDGTDAPNARETREVMVTPIDSIEIPERFVRIAGRWYGGQGCMLYAVSSTGGLTIGTIRPRGCCTNEQWYYSIWCDLAGDVSHARYLCEGDCNGHDEDYDVISLEEYQADYADLVDFEVWCDEVVDRLCAEYKLEDWDPHA